MPATPTLREKLHSTLLKARDVYRAGVKRSRYKAEIAEYNARLGQRVDVDDFLKARKQTDCDVEEYFAFEFYNKNEAERDAYLTRVRRSSLIRKMGDVDEGITIPGNKVLFNMLFGEFLRREWINPTAATEEEFIAFVRRLGTVIVKPGELRCGIGIEKCRCESEEEARALYRRLRGEGFVVEEVLRQHPSLDALNPGVINTLRIATYTDADDVHILATALRTASFSGEGHCVDNMKAGGLGCPVDAETGKIWAPAFNVLLERFEKHPLTGTPFAGFQVPLWDEVLSTVRAIARKAYFLPQCHFIGWDVAVTPDGPAVIEGNWQQGCDIIEYGGQKGIYHELRHLMEKR